MAEEITGYELLLSDIVKYNSKRKSRGDYSNGGFYLITDKNDKYLYVGKSIDVMLRLKNHLHNARRNTGLEIDKLISQAPENFKFYLIDSYINLKIDFFTRHLESIIEHQLIGSLKTYHPHGLNFKYYDKLRVK